MRKSNPDSRIEVWPWDRVNNSRDFEDREMTIIQIEPGSSEDDYIVEVIEKDAN